MNSNKRNHEAQAAAEAAEEHEIRVTDKRRVNSDEQPVDVEIEEAAEQPSESLESVQAKLKEVEEKRNEAERKVSEFADRFRKAQEQLKAENDEIRARLNRTFEQKLEAARGDLVAGLLDTLDNLKRAVAAAEK